jgi:hypothetical protein
VTNPGDYQRQQTDLAVAAIRIRIANGWRYNSQGKLVPPPNVGYTSAPTASPTPPPPPRARNLWRPLFAQDSLYHGLPWRIHVPRDLQERLALANRVQYRGLEASAASLYDGVPPLLLTGDDDYPGSSLDAGDRYATWALGVLLRNAPDDRSRENALIAIGNAPIIFNPWDTPRMGWYAVLKSLQSSGRAHHYQGVFGRQTAVRDMLRALWIETSVRDRKVRRGLNLPTFGLPSPGWAKRVTQELWNGSFPGELRFQVGIEDQPLDGPSFWTVWVAAHFAANTNSRTAVIRSLESLPEAYCGNVLRRIADILTWSQPAEYRAILSKNPRVRSAILTALTRDARWPVPSETWRLVGGSPPR